MREIRFRAWTRYGTAEKPYWLMVDMDNFCIGYDGKPGNYEGGWEGSVEFEPLTDDTVLMQYTGLKDKNGREIYEGDVVGMFGRSQLSEVFWGPEAGGWMVIAQDSGASPIAEGFVAQYTATAEVIGNIYENPELLEKSSP